LELLAGEGQLNLSLRAADKKLDAEMRFEPLDLLAERRGAMLRRSAARAKCNSDATAAK